MAVTLEQIGNTIRTYEQALKNNPLSEEEKEECLRKIKEYKNMKQKFIEKNN